MMNIATVTLVGIDQLEDIPAYLDLGAVVVVVPDRLTLARWHQEQHRPLLGEQDAAAPEMVIDLPQRQVRLRGEPLHLSDLEFRVLARLLGEPRSARSFQDLRRAGWEKVTSLEVDVYSVRALIQRLRVTLRAADAPVRIEAVRGYGYRIRDNREDASGPVRGADDVRSA
jgi:DNA-binding response OmpR family regulator